MLLPDQPGGFNTIPGGYFQIKIMTSKNSDFIVPMLPRGKRAVDAPASNSQGCNGGEIKASMETKVTWAILRQACPERAEGLRMNGGVGEGLYRKDIKQKFRLP